MQVHNFFQSKKFKCTLGGIAMLAILLAVFKAGEFMGYRKADFSYRWAENYHRNFGGPVGGFLRGFQSRTSLGGHGSYGPIIKIEPSLLTIQGRDHTEKIIKLFPATVIRRSGETIAPSDLKVDDRIVVIGAPNSDGQIEAKFIRVFR